MAWAISFPDFSIPVNETSLPDRRICYPSLKVQERIRLKDLCEEKALKVLKSKDKTLAAFYANAAKGFEIKIGNMTLGEALDNA